MKQKATFMQKRVMFLVVTPFDMSPMMLSKDNPLGGLQLFARSLG